ncbi:C4-dicarboxylate-binding protein [Psychromonas sp. CNPT3]|uniref:TRAP transporter substrate-binding protein n=1 Tax=Psychromonas sp. CNPT3 TaxID=314282 RepID=UPI00006E7087|nr:TRAP transporter substrate-binding protein [Psychromonas sp. CNPT3]AGH80053.1 C4-dicarboxylate-binding protein [Psychromonas sp. CNPT3]
MLNKKAFKVATLALTLGTSIGFASFASATTEMKAAFNQSKFNPQYLALEDFGQKLNEQTDGRYHLTIYANELLGDQRASLELVQSGAIQMAIVANPLVENYNSDFGVLALPYIYNGPKHQEAVYTSNVLDDLFASSKKFGFEVLTAYTAGARSMYTKKAPVTSIADMKGQKIRVMQSDTMISMLACMGGTGVPMGQGEVYTAIQQGVLDGAENNEITYADLKHYEVAPFYSRTRHVMVADLVVINNDFIDAMTPSDQVILRKLAKESTTTEFTIWNNNISKAIAVAKANGATFTDVDIAPFQKSCKPLQEKLLVKPAQIALFKTIRSLG